MSNKVYDDSSCRIIAVTPYSVESRDNFAGVFPHIKGVLSFRMSNWDTWARMHEDCSNRDLPNFDPFGLTFNSRGVPALTATPSVKSDENV